MPYLSISLLGPFRATLGGEPVARFRSDTVQALLAYLAMHAGTAFRRESLAALLWPDDLDSVARVNLRQALRRLRTAIGDEAADPPFLGVTRETLAFNLESDCRVDAAAFVEAVAAVKGHTHPRLEACSACAERLREAVELYRGEFLAGFSLPSALFEEWMVVEREHLHGQALEALAALAAYCEEHGQYEEALGYARRQVELEPWRESAHQQVMRALALSGQRGAALAQYEACRRVLADELGIEPEPETVALYERIKSGAELAVGVAPPPHNLPAQLTPFIGRERELAEIAERLADPACRLLALVGPGGSGKTRLALEAAARQLDRYPDGAYFVSLAPLPSVEVVVPTVAQAIGFTFYGGGNPWEQLLNYLRHKKMLFILDNAEHLLRQHPIAGPEPGQRDVVDVAVDMLREAPEVVVLVTSRARLGALGAQALSVGGMDLPPLQLQAVDADGGPYGALRLFLSAGRRVEPGFALTVDDLPHAVRICHLLHGMPLGILLAASWIGMLTPAEIERELVGLTPGKGLDFLESDLHDVPARQRSMRTVFDYSWSLLTARQRGVMQAMSVFRGGCTREAAQEIADASLRDLMSLVDRSLLDRTPAGRYEVHELLRQYASERLDLDSITAAEVRDRHTGYYMTALARWETDLKSARQRAVLAEMDVEFDNVRTAWEWAVERGQIADLERAAEGLSLYCELRSRDPEGEAAFRKAADKIEETYGPLALARMRMWQGASAYGWHLTEIADRSLRQSLELLDRPELAAFDLRLERGILLYMLGCLGFDAGREDTAQRFEESLALFRALDNRWWAGRAMFWLGILANEAGEYGSAKCYYEESLAAFQTQGDPRWSANAWGFTGVAYLWLGQVELGEQRVRESLASMRALGDRAGMAGALEGMSFAARLAGRFTEAEAWMERCLAIWDDLGTRRTTVMQNLGRVKVDLGQYDRARALGQEELALVQQRDQRRIAGMYLDLLGIAALPGGTYEQAHCWLQEALGIFREFGMRGWRANTEAVTGYAARGVGRPDRARGHLVESLCLARELESWWPVALALPAIALLLTDRPEAERAIELYALASTFPYVAHSRWFEDVAGKHIAAAAATLPPEAVAAAQERGRSRDLWATVEELLAELSKGARCS